MALWDKIRNQNMKDTIVLSQLSDISYKASGGVSEKGRTFRDGIVSLGQLPFQEKQPTDKITKEMILDYHKKQNEPMIDPLTGKYISTDAFNKSQMVLDVGDVDLSKLPPPPVVDFPSYGKPADQALIDLLNQDIGKDINDLSIKKQEYKDIYNEIVQKKYDIDYNENSIKIEKKKKNSITKRNDPERKRLEQMLLNMNNDIKRFKTDLIKLEQDLQQKQQEIERDTRVIENKQITVSQAQENIEENKKLKSNYYQEINKKLQDYKESIYSLNLNKINQGTLERNPNESNEDYLQRMKDFENQQLDVNLYQDKAGLEQINLLKKNLRRLFNKEDLIENVIKSFTMEQQFQINKYFGAIAEYIFDTYGRNNSNLTSKDIVEVITSVLERLLNPEIEYSVEEETPSTAPTPGITNIQVLQDDTGNNTDFQYGVENNSFVIKNTGQGKHVFFKIGEDNKGKHILLYSTDENKLGGHFKQVMNNQTSGKDPQDVLRNIINRFLKLDTYAKTKILNNHYTNTSDLIDYIKDSSTFNIQPFKEGFKQREKFLDRFGRAYYRSGAGLGIRDPNIELPEYSRFGKLIIALKKLYYKNILSVKTHNGRSVDGFNVCKVSNGFVDAIMDMYDNKDVSGILDSLNPNERNLLNRLIYLAGLHKKFKTNNNETLRQLKEKYKIIEGEIQAGNNNPKMIEDLKSVLYELHHMDAISIPAINKYLKQFK